MIRPSISFVVLGCLGMIVGACMGGSSVTFLYAVLAGLMGANLSFVIDSLNGRIADGRGRLFRLVAIGSAILCGATIGALFFFPDAANSSAGTLFLWGGLVSLVWICLGGLSALWFDFAGGFRYCQIKEALDGNFDQLRSPSEPRKKPLP